MRTNLLFSGTLALLASTGCAHQPEPDEPVTQRVVPESMPASTTRRPKLVPPEKDPRYALPQARSRALTIFLGSQTFEYLEDGRVIASGEVSTGSSKHPTPAGSFSVLSKDKDKRSSKYTNYFDQNTPMPYSLQFRGPYFIHEGWIPGYADSHGCVRLHYEDARFLFTRMRVGDPVRVKPKGSARPANPWPDLFPIF